MKRSKTLLPMLVTTMLSINMAYSDTWLIPAEIPEGCNATKVTKAISASANKSDSLKLYSRSVVLDTSLAALEYQLLSFAQKTTSPPTTNSQSSGIRAAELNSLFASISELSQRPANNDNLNVLVNGDSKSDASVAQLFEFYNHLPANTTIWLLTNSTSSSAAQSAANNSSAKIRYIQCDESKQAPANEERVSLANVALIIEKQLGIPSQSITLHTNLRLLGADEYALFELLQVAAESFGLQGSPTESINEVSEILAYLNDLPRSRGFAKAETAHEQTVYFGTNRAHAENTTKLEYSGARNPLGTNEYGLCRVSIPIDHKKGKLEGPFMGLKLFEDPSKHVLLQAVEPLTREAFIEPIGMSQKDEDASNKLVIFVHGFNVSFQAAAMRTAQISHDIGFSGMPLFFSWPSDASVFAYTRDREDANWSRKHLEDFLLTILSASSDRKIHLIAHSMGNQVLIGALHQMALRNPNQMARFQSVVLAAPDFDAELFSDQIAPEIVGLAKNWTIYTSDKDSALMVSQTVNSARRLGQPVRPIADMTVIDATGVEVTPWSVPEFHSYYATKHRVVNDIISVVTGKSIEQRELIKADRAGINYWRFDE